MSQVPQHLIDEATRRGIVPGAQVKSADGGRPMTVAPIEEWKQGSAGSIYNGRFLCGSRLFDAFGDAWAAVITPVPSQRPQAIGLQEGDAVECGPAMRAAIIELAKELGVHDPEDIDIEEYQWRGVYVLPSGFVHRFAGKTPKRFNLLTPEAFIARMRVTASHTKPITIGGKTVKFYKGEINVGCTTISNETVRAIAAKLID